MPTTTGKATDFITFSRASLATVTDSDGLIHWASHNLLLASEQFDASNWTKTFSATTANSVAAPNGSTTADTIAEDTTTNVHAVSQTFTASAVYTYSVFLKYNNLQYVSVSLNNNSNSAEWASAVFDIQNGTLASQNAVTLTFVGTPTITAVGSGWYLCTVSANLTAVANGQVYLAAANASSGASFRGAQSYLGSSRSFYAWGAHLYRSDLGGMVANTSAYPMYNPTTPKNLLGFTEAFDNAAWGKTGLTATANTTIAPNGLSTADTLNDGSATSNHYMAQTISTVAGSTYTASVYGKNVDGTYLIIDAANLGGASTFASAVFNLSTGAVSSSSAVGTGYSVVSTRISSIGDGWYLCSLTFVAGTTAPTSFCVAMTNSTSIGAFGLFSYTGSNKTILVWGAQLSDSASLDPYVPNYFAAPTAAAYNGPRLDYSANGSALGLLVEEQRTNLLLRSAEFDNAAWTKTETSVSANAIVAPSGATTADKIVESASAAAWHNVAISYTYTAASHIFSVYLKAGERTWAYFDTFFTAAYFNLATGTIGTVAGGTATMQAVGDGWYRCSVTYTATATLRTIRVSPSVNGSDAGTYAGDGTSGIFIWGAQLEAGSFATSYIPTVASTVTRSADVASVATSAFPYSATEGSFVAAFQTLYSGLSPASYWVIGMDGSTSKRVLFVGSGSDQVITNDGVTSTAAVGDVTGAITKAGAAFSANTSASIVANGGVVAAQASLASGFLTSTSVDIGCRVSSNTLNGHIRQITYIPRRLSNAELQARTL